MNYRTESWSKTSSQTARRARHQWRGAVESLEQKQLLATFTVSDFGSDETTPNTLAWAIIQANGNPGFDTIDFNLGSGGRQTINITSNIPLPAITDFVLIDGTSQPGFNPSELTPVIQINGEYLGDISTNPPFYFTPTPNAYGFLINTGAIATSSTTTIKGLAIGGFTGSGIEIVDSNNVVIQGSHIGVDFDGLMAMKNCSAGIVARNSGNIQIGGINESDSNIISGNDSSGVVFINVTGGAIQGNKIGVDRTGIHALPNGQDGINLTNSIGILIGVETPTQPNPNPLPAPPVPPVQPGEFLTNPSGQNIIAANGRDGVVIWGPQPGNSTLAPPPFTNQVINNVIGFSRIDFQGLEVNLGNKGNGVTIGDNASGNLIQQNFIASNGDTGVAVVSGNFNALYANEYYNNVKLGIDLNYDGSTPNDEDDSDRGANENINYPNLTSAQSSASSTTILGNYQGAANTILSIQVYTNPVSQNLNPAQGRTYLGYINVTTDGDGVANFKFVTNYRLELSEKVTAIASDTKGNTSEISGFVQVTPAPTDLAISMSAGPASVVINSSTTVTTTVVNQGTSNATDVVVTIVIPNGFTITSTSPAGLTIQNNVVTSNYASLNVGVSQVVTVIMTATQTGTFALGSSVTLNETDIQPANNQASANLTVTAAPTGGGGGGTNVEPPPVVIPPVDPPIVVPPTSVVPGPAPRVTTVQRIVAGRRINVRLTFDQPMNGTSVANASNYYFTFPGKDNKFGTPDDKTVGAQSAVYNPTTNSVLVTPYQPHSINTRQIRMTVLGVTSTGLVSSTGTPLDGANVGKPSNFLTAVPFGNTILKTSAIAKARRLIR